MSTDQMSRVVSLLHCLTQFLRWFPPNCRSKISALMESTWTQVNRFLPTHKHLHRHLDKHKHLDKSKQIPAQPFAALGRCQPCLGENAESACCTDMSFSANSEESRFLRVPYFKKFGKYSFRFQLKLVNF